MIKQAPRRLSRDLRLGSGPKSHSTSSACVNRTQSRARAGLALNKVAKPEEIRSYTEGLQCALEGHSRGSARRSRPGPSRGVQIVGEYCHKYVGFVIDRCVPSMCCGYIRMLSRPSRIVQLLMVRQLPLLSLFRFGICADQRQFDILFTWTWKD